MPTAKHPANEAALTASGLNNAPPTHGAGACRSSLIEGKQGLPTTAKAFPTGAFRAGGLNMPGERRQVQQLPTGERQQARRHNAEPGRGWWALAALKWQKKRVVTNCKLLKLHN